LVSQALLYWNTLKIHAVIESLRSQGEEIDDEAVAPISLLPFKPMVPKGTSVLEEI